MTFSLACTVDAAADRLPAALVAPDALDLVRRLAATLPASITHWVDFECRLAANRPQVDLSLRIDRRGRDRLAGYASAREAMAPPGAAPAWSRVASFAREWSDGATAVHIEWAVCGSSSISTRRSIGRRRRACSSISRGRPGLKRRGSAP